MTAPASRPPDLARQKLILRFAIVTLALAAIVIATLVTSIPLPARLLAAGTDLAAAAVLVVLYRQKFSA